MGEKTLADDHFAELGSRWAGSIDLNGVTGFDSGGAEARSRDGWDVAGASNEDGEGSVTLNLSVSGTGCRARENGGGDRGEYIAGVSVRSWAAEGDSRLLAVSMVVSGSGGGTEGALRRCGCTETVPDKPALQ